jgi:hypothetical protein
MIPNTPDKFGKLLAMPNAELVAFGEPYAGGVAPQTPIGGRYAALQTSHVGVDGAELPRCLY